MSRWRLAIALFLTLAIAVPLALPFLDLVRYPSAWDVWTEADRLLSLVRNTLLLVAGTLLLALPAGIVLAIFVYRTDLPGRRLFRFLILLMLFVPLPLFTSAWQAVLGSGGAFPLASWTTPPQDAPEAASPVIPWKPWAQGLPAAIWVHAVAGLPWVVLLVGQGLLWVERDLEEDALTTAPPWRVLLTVTLRRSVAAIGAAALWLAVQGGTEMTVTDMMQVRTFSEEVYTQFVREDRAPILLARVVALTLPQVVLTIALILVAVRSWERSVPPLRDAGRPLLYRLGMARWPALLAVGLLIGLVVAVPLGSLLWKAGLGGRPLVWSWTELSSRLDKALRVHGTLVITSLALALVAGMICAGLGLIVSWLSLGSGRWFRSGLMALCAAAWAIPGPVIGLGLNAAILLVLTTTNSDLLDRLLYRGPSAVPLLWAWLLRFFPCAVAILWPVVRLVPPALRDAVRVDGAGPFREFQSLIIPLTTPAFLRAAGAVAVLAMGELAASKIVEVPGSNTFAHEVFNQMHNGVTADLAALCLVLLAVVGVGGALVLGIGTLRNRSG